MNENSFNKSQLSNDVGPSITNVDNIKQELYEAQLQLKTKNALIIELQSDNTEQLHIVEDENIKLKSEITTKESGLRQWNLKYCNLEFKISEQQKEHLIQINSLNEQISSLKVSMSAPKIDLPINSNECIITELKTELYDKKNKFDEIQNILNEQETTEELEESKTQVEFKTEHLREWKQKHEAIQEECEMLRLQVNSIQNLIDHNKRGNSLFAEVDDKCQALTLEVEIKREKCEILKKCLTKANHENSQLKMEIMRCEKQLLDSEKNDDLVKSTLIQGYKNRLSDLEAKIRYLEERPCSPQLLQMKNIGNDDGMNVVSQIVADAEKLKKMVEDEINRSTEARQLCFEGGYEISQLKTEMRRDKLQLKEFKQQISVLKSKITSSKENMKEDKNFMSKGVSFHENCKLEDG